MRKQGIGDFKYFVGIDLAFQRPTTQATTGSVFNAVREGINAGRRPWPSRPDRWMKAGGREQVAQRLWDAPEQSEVNLVGDPALAAAWRTSPSSP